MAQSWSPLCSDGQNGPSQKQLAGLACQPTTRGVATDRLYSRQGLGLVENAMHVRFMPTRGSNKCEKYVLWLAPVAKEVGQLLLNNFMIPHFSMAQDTMPSLGATIGTSFQQDMG